MFYGVKTMLKSKCWYAFLPAVLILGMPFGSVAKIIANGISLNGTALQSFTVANQGVLRAENGQLVIQTNPTAP